MLQNSDRSLSYTIVLVLVIEAYTVMSKKKKKMIKQIFDFFKSAYKYWWLEGTGAYGPLLLSPAEGLGGPLGPLTCGGNLF